MNNRKKLLIIMIIFLGMILLACSNKTDSDKTADTNKEPEEQEQEEVEQEEPEPEPEPEPEVIEREITVSAIGDMLIHERVYNTARLDGGGFDFVPILKDVEPFLNETMISFANQETVIGGEEIGLSTYPAFNSPVEVGDALKEVGVNVVSIANNHTLDRGEQAILNSIEHWNKIDMMYVGAYENEEDRKTVRVFETDEGIDVAFLAYTYGTNGIPVPEGKPYLVNLIDKELIMAEVAEAKELADVVILSLHFGNEYERMPNDEQKDLTKFAADLGVDVILGHHPHVLQPIDWVEGKDGNQTLVVYSLGNFLSGQDQDIHRQIGGIFQFTIKQTLVDDEEESLEVLAPKFVPTYVANNGFTKFEVLPMYQLTDDILPNAAEQYEDIKAHMNQWVPELEFPEP